MNRSIRYAWFCAFAFGFSPQSLYAGENPKYAVWAKFSQGATSTLSADFRQGSKNIRIEVVKTLKAISPDQVVVETISIANGKADPAKSETILAKTDKDDIKITGTKEILAMGKTFQCQVWDAGSATGGQAIIYVTPEVPGGVVELDTVRPDGKKLIFVLTSMQSK